MNKTRQLLISLLTPLCCCTGAWALNQDDESNYLLSTAQDWKDFATLVQTMSTANAKMTADIDLGDDQTMIGIGTSEPDANGSSNIKYQGTFDGQGHTLTVHYVAEDHITAPFRFIQEATIKNLRVDGNIVTTFRNAGGIVGICFGQQKHSYIENCISSVNIISSYVNTGDFYGGAWHGGIASRLHYYGQLHITDCIFNGSISGENSGVVWGGILGLPDGTATITNCLQTGTFDCSNVIGGSNGSGTISIIFSNGYASRVNISNCHYLNAIGNIQGTQVTEETLANGTITTALNAGRTSDEAVWVQYPLTNQPMLKLFATEQEPDGMFCYLYDHDAQTATVTYLRDSDNNKKGGTYVGDVVIPAKAPNGYDVTVIGEDAFYNCPEMTSLTIPATIDSIGCEPFADSGAQLAKITIEDGDTPIRCHVRDAWPMGCYPVFGRDVNVEELYIGRHYSSFVSRGWVEAVYEGSWSLIKDSEHLKKVTLGNVFTEVPYAMFYGCTQLQEVNISPNAKSVGKEAFSHCESLIAIDLPEGIETIDEEAFYYCKALGHIGLPKTLRVIGGNAFTNCDAFCNFTIPASIDSIGANILADCDNLKRIDIAYNPEPLKYYCPSQFQNSLRSAPIDTLYTDRYIDGALSDNRTLKKLYIGSNVTALHDYNFSDCYNIDEVFSMNPEPPTCEGSSVFYSSIKQNGTLHVPAGSLDAYKEAYIWKDFFNIVDDIDTFQYNISTAQEWIDFAIGINDGLIEGNTNARMTADIYLGNSQMVIGTLEHPYQGIFDGQGHTLTVNYDMYLNTNAVAPFAVVGDAIIQRLHVDGSIKQQVCGAGGVAGTIVGNLIVRECWVSAYMYVQGSGWLQGTIGGIASYCDDPNVTNREILIEDCMFTGELGTSIHSGSIMSHVNGDYGNHATIRNCLNMGIFPGSSGTTGTFIRPIQGENFVIENCFYKNSFGYVQGTWATDEQLADGNTASALQAGRSELVWVQDMNTETPMLMVFSKNPDPDGIESLTPNPSPKRGEIYNLNGQIVNGKWLNGKLPRGIYIIEGKKVVIR